MPAATSEECCKAFMKHIARFGVPRLAISDNGNSFIANLYQDVMKTFNIEVRFTPAYHPATNGAIERRHQTIKNALKASLIDMGSHHGEKWMRALPWVLLGKRIAYQPDLDTSSALLLYGRSPEIPGQLLSHPGPPLTSLQTKALLEEMFKLESNPALQTSSKANPKDLDHTKNATHVYIKLEDPKGLSGRFEGPFEIVSRPSRSQIQVKIGVFANGQPRLSIYNWQQCKIAHLREGFIEGSRPALGRKPQVRPNPPAVVESLPVETNNNDAPKQTKPESPPNIQPVYTRPVRTTRNANPQYVDAVFAG